MSTSSINHFQQKKALFVGFSPLERAFYMHIFLILLLFFLH